MNEIWWVDVRHHSTPFLTCITSFTEIQHHNTVAAAILNFWQKAVSPEWFKVSKQKFA